jgi:hypothetical protein
MANRHVKLAECLRARDDQRLLADLRARDEIAVLVNGLEPRLSVSSLSCSVLSIRSSLRQD